MVGDTFGKAQSSAGRNARATGREVGSQGRGNHKGCPYV